jgi:hypothetical protein
MCADTTENTAIDLNRSRLVYFVFINRLVRAMAEDYFRSIRENFDFSLLYRARRLFGPPQDSSLIP